MNNQKYSFVIKLVKCVIQKLQLEDYHIDIDDSSATSNGYLGVIFFVEVTHRKGTLHLAVKASTQEENQRSYLNVNQLFNTEINFYQTVFPGFNEFQKEKSIERPFDSVPKCYYASCREGNEGLVMENLRAKGFRLWNKQLPMDENHVALVLREYGRFHAISYALRDQSPDTFHRLSESMDDSFKGFFERTRATDHKKARLRTVSSVLRKQGRDDVADKLDKFLRELHDFILINCVSSDRRHPQAGWRLLD